LRRRLTLTWARGLEDEGEGIPGGPLGSVDDLLNRWRKIRCRLARSGVAHSQPGCGQPRHRLRRARAGEYVEVRFVEDGRRIDIMRSDGDRDRVGAVVIGDELNEGLYYHRALWNGDVDEAQPQDPVGLEVEVFIIQLAVTRDLLLDIVGEVDDPNLESDRLATTWIFGLGLNGDGYLVGGTTDPKNRVRPGLGPG